MKPDEILDDQALVINTEHVLIILVGCSHRAVVNTIYHAQKVTGKEKVYMVLGGCHLIDPDNEARIKATIDVLKELNVQRVGLSHCTGLPASVQLVQALGDRFSFNNVGTITSMDES